jgi:hypothetical protein
MNHGSVIVARFLLALAEDLTFGHNTFEDKHRVPPGA